MFYVTSYYFCDDNFFLTKMSKINFQNLKNVKKVILLEDALIFEKSFSFYGFELFLLELGLNILKMDIFEKKKMSNSEILENFPDKIFFYTTIVQLGFFVTDVSNFFI